MLTQSAHERGSTIAPELSTPQRASTRFDDLVKSSGVPIRYRRDVEIYGEGEPAEYFYKVISGSVRTYRVLVDGRRQVCAFKMRGEFFGFESNGTHGSSAEAVANTDVLVIKRSVVMIACERDIEIARNMWSLTDADLKRVQTHALLLIKTAKERVAAFLEAIATPSANGGEVQIPMSRRDIADHLGITIETVSRTLTELELRGAIRLPNVRTVVLLNREALSQATHLNKGEALRSRGR